MDTGIKLTEEQERIINSDANTLVVSNPGTGKTTTLAFKALHLLKNGAEPEQILCITFTEKARKEMHDAIYRNCDKELAPKVSKITISTFHSFALDTLINEGKLWGEVIDDDMLRFSIFNSLMREKVFEYSREYIISDIMPMIEKAIRYIKSFGIKPDNIDVKKASKILEDIADESSYTPAETRALLEHFVHAYNDYEEVKKDNIDYTDMLIQFLAKCKGRRFEHVLIDEIQDMNKMEAEIARKVAKNLFLMGDPKQAIFGFQGGSTTHFKEFEDTCTRMLLSKNRRSVQEILDYSKQYYLANTDTADAEDLAEFRSESSGSKPVIISTKAPMTNILDIIHKNPGKSIGVITSTNKRINEISGFLDMHDIKYSSTSSQATTTLAKNEIRNFLNGLFSDLVADKIRAAFTTFSPYSLQEAFRFARQYEQKGDADLQALKSEEQKMGRGELDSLFKNTILPICVSKGQEWFATAIRLKQKIDDYFGHKKPTLEGLLDYIATSGDAAGEATETRADDNGTDVLLTTIHKAKGREFDVVAYLPNNTTKKKAIDVIVSAILQSYGIDPHAEMSEEEIRRDFVAFTRAKHALFVITDEKMAGSYHIEGLSEFMVDELVDDMRRVTPDAVLSEAYSMFVAGRIDDAKKLLENKDRWLEEYIRDYFAQLESFSYSKITTDPYQFLKNNIIRMPFDSKSMTFGTKLHSAMCGILSENATIEKYSDDLKRAVQNGMNAINDLKKEYKDLKVYGLEKDDEEPKMYGLEMKINVPLNAMTDYNGDAAFTGKLDAVFKHESGYLIIDYKTDRDESRSAKHKQQLAAYRKMLSVSEGIPEEEIDTCVVFVAIRGKVNTGRYDYEIDISKKNTYATFEKHLQKVLEWKNDYKKFIGDLLQAKSDEPLHAAVCEKLVMTREDVK